MALIPLIGMLFCREKSLIAPNELMDSELRRDDIEALRPPPPSAFLVVYGAFSRKEKAPCDELLGVLDTIEERFERVNWDILLTSLLSIRLLTATSSSIFFSSIISEI